MGLRLASPGEARGGTAFVRVPGADAAVAVRMRWRILDDGDINAALSDGGEAGLLRKVVAGWEDVYDADGDPIAFGAEALGRLCEVAYFRRGVVDSYLRWVAGVAEKN